MAITRFMTVEKEAEGIFNVTLFVKGEEATAQFLFQVETDMEKSFFLSLALNAPFPLLNSMARIIRPLDVGIHSKSPYPGVMNPTRDADGNVSYCEHTGGECYYDGSTTHAQEMLNLWKQEGGKNAVYDELENLVWKHETDLMEV